MTENRFPIVFSSLIAAVLTASPVLYAEDASSIPFEYAPAAEMETAALELKDSVADSDVSDGQVHRDALNLFSGAVSGDRMVVASYRTKTEWFDSDASFDTSLTNQPDQIRRILRKAKIAPPQPGQQVSRDDPSILWEILAKYEEMMTAGTVSYDGAGKLSKNQLGVFEYQEKDRKSIGITFNQHMKGAVHMLSAPVGSLATAMHEAAHRYFLDQGELNSKEVKKGEMFSFKIQNMFLQAWDPRGYYLATVNWVLNNKVGTDPFYKGVAGHMMDVRRYAQKKDLKGLVDYLGYEDKAASGGESTHANRIRCQHDHGHEHAHGS